jgi:hypothetical protein
MPDAIAELLITEAAIDKLGALGITTQDAHRIPRNAYIVVRNPHKTTSPAKRRLFIGRIDGGRAPTLVIEETVDPTSWLIVTGWDSSPRSVNC